MQNVIVWEKQVRWRAQTVLFRKSRSIHSILRLILHQIVYVVMYDLIFRQSHYMIQFVFCGVLNGLWLRDALSFNLVHRWPRSRSAPWGKGPGNGGRCFPLSHPAGNVRGSRRRQTATGTSAGSGSPPGSAAGHNGRTCADGHTPGKSSNWFWWFPSSQKPGTGEEWEISVKHLSICLSFYCVMKIYAHLVEFYWAEDVDPFRK